MKIIIFILCTLLLTTFNVSARNYKIYQHQIVEPLKHPIVEEECLDFGECLDATLMALEAYKNQEPLIKELKALEITLRSFKTEVFILRDEVRFLKDFNERTLRQLDLIMEINRHLRATRVCEKEKD